jgi:hypothetical protein
MSDKEIRLFRLGLLAKTADTIWRNLLLCLLVLALVSTARFLEFRSTACNYAAISILLFVGLRSVLADHGFTQPASPSSRQSVVLHFIVKVGVMLTIPGIVAFAIAVLLLAYRWNPSFAFGVGIMFNGLLLCFILAKWGTALPALFTNADPSQMSAARRGSKTFGFAFSQLLLPLVVVAGIQTVVSTNVDFLLLRALVEATLVVLQSMLMAVILARSFVVAETLYADAQTKAQEETG